MDCCEQVPLTFSILWSGAHRIAKLTGEGFSKHKTQKKMQLDVGEMVQERAQC